MKAPRSLILETSVEALFHTALLFSLFLLFAGHNAPGGGFVGGLVGGAAFVLRYLDAGPAAVAQVTRVSPQALLGSGLALAAITGTVPWLTGGQFLQSAKLSFDLPILGTVKTTSSLPFDMGVYLVVIGLVLAVLDSLGREADRWGR